MIIWLFIFVLSIGGILHSYLAYPLVIRMLAPKRKGNELVYTDEDELPEVAVLLAAHNEESVIVKKIEHTFNTQYPLLKLQFYIGSDASTDRTHELIRELQKKYPNLKLKIFEQRTGKAGIINALAREADSPILIATDANILFEEHTIYELVKHFKNPDIQLVAGNIIYQNPRKGGISMPENRYLSMENSIKHHEARLWRLVIGAEGGCYAIRKAVFPTIPPLFFMEDFYVTMHVLEQGGKATFEKKASCYEDVSTKSSEEFKRKVRISIGNFQNLKRYAKLLLPFWKPLSFAFWSHKVLRWLSPFFMILALLSNLFLLDTALFFQITLIGQLFLILLSLMDMLLRRLRIHIGALRYISHFYYMNLALLKGFYNYLKGVQSNVWKPTERNQ